MSQTREATAYLQLAPRAPRPYGGYWGGSSEASVVRCTNKPPAEPIPGCIVVKVRIRVPDAAWRPISPTVVIDVPADLVQHPVEVEAVDAR